MKILFLYFNYASPVSYGIGVATLSAILKARGHDVTIVHLNELMNMHPFQWSQAEECDAVCISAISTQQRFVIELLKQKPKGLKSKIIVGGLSATFDPQALWGLADCIVRGEAETLLPQIIENNLFGIVTASGYSDLSRLPPLDFDAFNYDEIIRLKNGWLEMMVGRGCPFSCSYCFNEEFKKLFGNGSYIRFKPIDLVLEELEIFKKQCPGLKVINFVDDNFTYSKSYLEKFLPLYQEKIGLPFLCATRPEFITFDIAQLLKENGCHFVRMALESGSKVGKKVLNRDMSNESLLEASKILQAKGLEVGVFNIIGIPLETKSDIQETLKINAKIKPATSKRTILLPFKGTRIYQDYQWAIDDDVLEQAEVYNNCQSPFRFSDEWKEMVQYYQTNWAEELSKMAGINYDFRWEESVAVREDYQGVEEDQK